MRMAKLDFEERIKVIARAPFHVYYDGEASAFSAKNAVGDFSILPGHADFFSMLEPCKVEIINGETITSFDVESGLVTVRDNLVYLFVNV